MDEFNQTTDIADPIVPVISEISKKYRLEETKEANIKRLEQGKLPKETFLVKISKDYYQKKITENDFVILISKNLEVSEEISKNILTDVKEKLIPVIEKIQKYLDDNTEEKKEAILIQTPPLESFDNKEEILPSPKKQTRAKKNIVALKEEAPPQIKQSSGPDSYREPIE